MTNDTTGVVYVPCLQELPASKEKTAQLDTSWAVCHTSEHRSVCFVEGNINLGIRRMPDYLISEKLVAFPPTL